MGRTIALATPVFFALIALEWAIGRARGRSNYRANDAINSLSLGVMSQVVGLFTRLLAVGIYAAVYSLVALLEWPADRWWTWAIAILAYDFCYYWNHRLGHESAVFWAAHVVHHQSQEYNLSTALRQTSSGALLGWIFYLPMAVAGIPPQVFVVAAVVNLLYQYWIHTEQIGRLGWFDRWFSSPSNHRVHHAVNDRYLDRNYGGILMVWDRIFGTFVEEGEKCVYGTRAPLDSWDPLWANLEVYADLARRSRRAARWRDRLAVWLMPPGWEPAPAGGPAWHKPAFDLARVRRYDPPMDRATRAFATVHFVLALAGALPLLWFADTLRPAALAAGTIAVVALLWITGAVMQGRLRLARALVLELLLLPLLWVAAGAAAAAGKTGPASAAPAAASASATAPAPSAAAFASPATPLPVIVDDPAVQAAVEAARREFLDSAGFDRMHVTVLVEDDARHWRRGSVEGEVLAYPASCVKLPFLIAAVHWCAAEGRAPDCLDAQVRPMIVESDNMAAGEVVDAVSGVRNGPLDGADLDSWIERRRYVEQVLDGHGLLRGQRLFTKTYPTNSGEEPAGLERAAWERLGRNAMSADAAAALMLAVVSGAIEPQATGYLRGLLHRPADSPHSALGAGLPGGSHQENKVGTAFDTLEDILYAELPDGRRLIVAAFTNGWNPDLPSPADVHVLGGFTRGLLAQPGLAPHRTPDPTRQ